MKYQEFDNAKLEEEIKRVRESVLELKFDVNTADLTKLKEYREAKKELSRLLTEKSSRKNKVN